MSLLTTNAAAERLGIGRRRFLQLVKAKGIKPKEQAKRTTTTTVLVSLYDEEDVDGLRA